MWSIQHVRGRDGRQVDNGLGRSKDQSRSERAILVDQGRWDEEAMKLETMRLM